MTSTTVQRMAIAGLLGINLLSACVVNVGKAVELYDEQFRPQFHFTAKQGWLNDPNGLVYDNGQYHMFYQHNPFGTGWGNMTWGHATSPDLIHWTELSPALAPDPTGVRFSGSAVIDTNNTAGLQTGSDPTMALFFTSVGPFDQRLAYSTDGGESFRYYAGNPVLPATAGKDDRDPRVFWDQGSNKWVQALWVAANGSQPAGIAFYGSPDLKTWSYLSHTPDYFETPDIFKLPVDGNAANSKWVLYAGDGKYQVGTFNGTAFVPDAPGAAKLTQDYGANFYAAQTWNNVPTSDGRRIQVGWMNGAGYPGMPFNQQMSFPVELTLHTTAAGVQMYRQPVAEIAALHGALHSVANTTLRPGTDPLAGLAGEQFHIKTQIELGTSSSVGFNIRGTQVTYNVASQTLSVLGRSAPLAPVNGRIDLELLVDRSSLEVFGNNGAVSLTNGFTPSASNQQVGLFATGGNARVVTLSAWDMLSAWPAQQPPAPQGLIGQWNFNEPTLAAGFVDASGRRLNFANSGIVASAAGVAGPGIDFDNAGDYAFIPDNSLLDADNLSVSLWFRPDASGAGANLIDKSRATGTNSWGLEQTPTGGVKFYVTTEGGATTSIQSPTAVSNGAWHHAVASYNANLGRMELYLDGSLAAAGEGVVAGPLLYDNSPLFLGQHAVGSGGPNNAPDGRLDQLQIYGHSLRPGEIEFLRNHPDLSVIPSTYAEGPLHMVVNSDTGAVTIVNSSGAPLAISGYSFRSNIAGLNVGGWQSFDDRTDPAFAAWQEANPSSSSLSETNPTGSLSIAGAAQLSLGNPAHALGVLPFGQAARNTEYSFDYVTSGGSVLHGIVELTGSSATNNLVLTVDPSSGTATVKNDSSYTVGLLGYTISSASGSLQPGSGAWNSLADQGYASWQEANPSTANLSELVPFAGNALLLSPGQTLSLGTILNIAGSQDLAFQFYMSTNPLQGDFNASARVDAVDLAAWQSAFGVAYAGTDFLRWQRHLGQTNTLSTPMIQRGVVRYGSGNASFAPVAEPASVALAAGGGLLLSLLHANRVSRRRRRQA